MTHDKLHIVIDDTKNQRSVFGQKSQFNSTMVSEETSLQEDAFYVVTQLTTTSGVLQHIDELVRLLQECVHDGHSMGFLSPLSVEEAKAYWLDASIQVAKSQTHLFIVMSATQSATASPEVLGTVQLAGSPKPSHSHRAEVNKLIISSSYRRKGLARKLMEEVESLARELGRDVLTLTTAKDSDAREMYLKMDWDEFGVCKDYAQRPDGKRADVSFFRKELACTTARSV
ncbi:acyl-CoA N-acyltransferase [Halenospora varia]|nr:acyl-CoA N-acyltransferase [Halenospora varia]